MNCELRHIEQMLASGKFSYLPDSLEPLMSETVADHSAPPVFSEITVCALQT